MEHENTYVLMMDALDGELGKTGRESLQVHLRTCPSCAREWQALVAIDTLFQQTPAVAPSADFAQRTMARLPNRRFRLWFVGTAYVLLLLGGLIPLLGGLWAFNNYGALLSEPSWLGSIAQTAVVLLNISSTVFRALLTGAGEFILQQPAIMGGFMVMIGLVAVWRGVVQQYIWQSAPAAVMNQ